MAKFEDLSGKTFGYFKVIERAPDHITKSGQKKVRWLCECQLCKTRKEINSQDLRLGNTISCGCYRAYNGKLSRNKKICVICGKEFESPPSYKTVTCSQECRGIYASKRRTGVKMSKETKRKISDSSKGRDISAFILIGVQAAKESPKSGRFKTNVKAIDWHLISPEGKHYYFHSLAYWMRENCREFFGCEPDSKEMKNALKGLQGTKSAMLGGKYRSYAYKGWRAIPTESDLTNYSLKNEEQE